ncbi:TIGR03067 domain-containing protein [Aquisphaera insulae]|uniref:TIGR03067 domain-containing protein n=1 Tax=Aquisphaera insulae TaxID=2712864 RepID=UPI0013ECA156|nr:TIGR03067 domain-containing protein [Aquisphaera insulae]
MSPIATLMLSLAALGGDPPAADLKALQGTWQVTSMEREGETVPAEDFKTWGVRYEGNRVTLMDGDRVHRRGIVTLDSSRKPKAVNTWDGDGPYADQTSPGIYELEGDTLRLAFAKPGEPRPTAFTTKSGSAVLVVTYKRVKK